MEAMHRVPCFMAPAIVLACTLGSFAFAQTPVGTTPPNADTAPSQPPAPPPPAPPPPVAAANPSPTHAAPVFVAVPMPAPTPPAPPAYVPDHETVVRKIGLSWLGVSDIPIAVAVPTGSSDSPGLDPNDKIVTRTVAAPALGVRLWLNRRVAIEPGLGVHYSGGKTSSELGAVTSDVDKQTTTALFLHMGMPLALGWSKHITLLAIPEVNFGTAFSNVKSPALTNPPPEAELRGWRLDVGARAGAEIHFGFLGMPELSLEGSVGLLMSHQRVSASVGNQSVTDTGTLLTTSSFNNPWDIFRGFGTVAARYYF